MLSVDACRKHLESAFPIGVLGSGVAVSIQVRGSVNDANCGVAGVAVLAAGSTATRNVNFDVTGVEGGDVFDLAKYDNSDLRRVPSPSFLVGRDSLDAVSSSESS